MSDKDDRSCASWIEGMIRDFINTSPENHLGDAARERAFDNPLVGFSSGDDPLYEAYKNHVGPFHWTPLEAFELAFGQQGCLAADLTVISWILPQTKATRKDNRRQKRFPSERWARARVFGEVVNVKLRAHVAAQLNQAGYHALAPMLLPQWERRISPQHGYASLWSERHAAYTAGLGTFGLCDGLITPKGKAMRTGSVIARIAIPASPRPYTDPHAYCLFYSHGTCGKCISRCPVGALSEFGHDKETCKAFMRQAVKTYIRDRYGFDGKGCGLCQTGVPCELKIPLAKKDVHHL